MMIWLDGQPRRMTRYDDVEQAESRWRAIMPAG